MFLEKILKMEENRETLDLMQLKKKLFSIRTKQQNCSQKKSEIKINKAKVVLNKSIYLGSSVLGMSKIVMYDCWFD